MNIVLALCPSWDISMPNLSLASLYSYIKKLECNVVIKDLNVDLYSKVNSDQKKYWNGVNACHWWVENLFRKIEFIQEDLINNIAKSILAETPDLICFTLYSTNIFFTFQLMRNIKRIKPDALICIGGPGAFYIYKNKYFVGVDSFDYLVLGEGENTLFQLIRNLQSRNLTHNIPGLLFRNKNNELIGNPQIMLIKSLDLLPYPDFSQFQFERYANKNLPLSWSRGCVNNCHFCFEISFWCNSFRTKSVNYRINEIKHYIENYEARHFQINDSLINPNYPLMNDFLTKMIDNKLGITWHGMACAHKKMTAEFISKMREAGCVNIMFGLESASAKVLKLMNKASDPDLNSFVIKNSFYAGIKPSISLIVGYPGEEECDFQETIEFVKRHAKYLSFVRIESCGIEAPTATYQMIDNLKLSYQSSIDWCTFDKKNTLDERIRRVRELSRIATEYVPDSGAFYDRDRIELQKNMTPVSIISSSNITPAPSLNPMSLEGKVILITGASSGIGRASSILFSRLGARIILVSRNESELKITLNQLAGKHHSMYCFDLKNIDDIPTFIKTIKNEQGTLTGLFHSAGIVEIASIKLIDNESIENMFAPSFKAALLLCRGFYKKDAKGGSIVLMSSVQSLRSALGGILYAASKAAIDAAVRSLSLELAKENIRVNSIVGGMVKTSMQKTNSLIVPKSSTKFSEKEHPLGGFGEAEDIANAAAFLLSDASKWITGTSMIVDGGFLAGAIPIV